jgi:hypothetical protein
MALVDILATIVDLLRGPAPTQPNIGSRPRILLLLLLLRLLQIPVVPDLVFNADLGLICFRVEAPGCRKENETDVRFHILDQLDRDPAGS